MLSSEWTDACESPDTPDPLPMPMQYMVSGDCVARSHRYADKAGPVMFNPVGQVVGQPNGVAKTAAVIQRLLEEYLDSVDGLTSLMADACADQRPRNGWPHGRRRVAQSEVRHARGTCRRATNRNNAV